jgi:hypothetical protein
VGATTVRRTRLAALPLLALLIVAVAIGAAARSGSSGQNAIDEHASIVAASVVLTFLGLTIVAFVLVIVWQLLDAQGNRDPGKSSPVQFPLVAQLMIGAATLAVLAAFALLIVHFGRHQTHGGALAPVVAKGAKPLPKSSPLPYSATAGIWSAASFLACVAAIVLYPRIRRRLRRRHQQPFRELPDLQGPDNTLGELLRDPLAAVTVADPRTEPDPRRAVIAAWVAMADVIGGLWRPRQDSEAPQEYLLDALVEAGVTSGPATRLTNLFEFARWGGHQVGEEMRDEAIAALDAVRTELRDAS